MSLNYQAQAVRLIDQRLKRNREEDDTAQHVADRPALVMEISMGTLRWFHRLASIAQTLCEHMPRDQHLRLLLLAGIYQVDNLSVPAEVSVHETVQAAKQLGFAAQAGFVNAVLRRYCREKNTIQERLGRDCAFQHSHPDWLMTQLKADWPDDWQRIVEANQFRPRITCVVNPQKTSTDDFEKQLETMEVSFSRLDNACIQLHTRTNLRSLPGYASGDFWVQDWGATLTLATTRQKARRILDACAAPGGKSFYLSCYAKPDELVAMEIDASRLRQMEQNCERLGLPLDCRQGDANELADIGTFDLVVADVPCSATGIIRRHPEIKQRRRASDIEKFAEQQLRILRSLWQHVAAGGELRYITCSVLYAENDGVVSRFLAETPGVQVTQHELPQAIRTEHGHQWLPCREHDGFYMASLSDSERL